MKIKGFTLLEMLLVLALTGLVVAIGWFVVSNFQEMGEKYRKESYSASEIALLDLAIRGDVRQASGVSGEANQLIMRASPLEILSAYNFHPEFVLRKGTRIDTFKVTSAIVEIHESNRGWKIQIKSPDSLQVWNLNYAVKKRARARK